ncbi:MAG: sugar ABC transporter ATP-binding protein [Bilifractor sp.]|nr:sugar ABC transporter ATP-binding protein [Eubacterium sp.]MDY2836566.1 sugar ABC transporter ATP-binding protein [Bilifractor sp.]
MSEYLLEMSGICKAFSGVQALDHVNFHIRPGKVMCLAGENGCGKSTLVKIISGVYVRDQGEVFFQGQKLDRITPAEATRLGIQVIYQDLSIFPNLTVRENLAINSEITDRRKIVNRKRWTKTAEEALAKIGYQIDLDMKMGELSVADKQLVAICRALLFNARLIIMDEPTTALTKREVDALFRTVRKLKEEGIAIMFISHKVEEIFEISDDVCIMRNGKNVFEGPTAKLTADDFSYYMTGRRIQPDPFVPEKIEEKPVLEVEKLCAEPYYHDISFQLRKGEILGITGLLGSGRTELAMSLFGLIRPDSGKIVLNGQPVSIKSPEKAKELRIGYVPEDRLTEGLCMQQPIADNIMLASLDKVSRRGILNHRKLFSEADKWVKTFSIATDDPHKYAQTLSGGNQQKIVLSKWMNNNLDILILNGPTVGVDIGAKQDIHHLVHGLAHKGLAVIIISDDISEVVTNCSRVIVMKEGMIVGEMQSEEITDQRITEIIH